MSVEHLSYIPEKDLRGYKLSYNVGADRLEQHLGITFPVKPEAVLLTGKNKLVYAVRNGVIPAVVAGIITRGRGEATGKYDHRYHAYFAEKESGLFTALHENMHGFNAMVNPDIPRQQDLIAKAIAERTVGRPVPLVDIEKVISFKCFDEGMAQWAAIETAASLPDDFNPADLNSMRNNLLSSQEATDNVQVDEEFIDREFEKLDEAERTYNHALELSGIKAMTEGAKAEAAMSDSTYITGYYFVSQAIPELQKSGIDTAEAINRLVLNPPSAIFDLRNPILYSQQLITKK